MYSVHPSVGLCTVVCTVCNPPRVGGITSGQNWFIQIGQTNGGGVAPASVATLQSFVLAPMALCVRPSQKGTTGQRRKWRKDVEENRAVSSVILGQLIT